MGTEVLIKHSKPDVFERDLPKDRLEHYLKQKFIAVDTETRGLNIVRDRLCLVQICDEEGVVSFVRYKDRADWPADFGVNVKQLLEDPNVLKVFHFARFDLAVLKFYLNTDVNPVFCTKIASKLVRTYTDRHGLKDLARELIGLELDKSDQASDWGKDDLTDSQIDYAANDVRVLVPIYKTVRSLLEREGRLDLALRLYQALPAICELDLKGWKDVFEH